MLAGTPSADVSINTDQNRFELRLNGDLVGIVGYYEVESSAKRGPRTHVVSFMHTVVTSAIRDLLPSSCGGHWTPPGRTAGRSSLCAPTFSVSWPRTLIMRTSLFPCSRGLPGSARNGCNSTWLRIAIQFRQFLRSLTVPV